MNSRTGYSVLWRWALITLVGLSGLGLATYAIILRDAQGGIDERELLLPKGYYTSVAWLSEDELVFMTAANAEVHPRTRRLVIHSLGSSQQREVPSPPTPEECYSESGAIHGGLQRLPNGNLGFIFACYILPGGGEKPTLYEWNRQTGALRPIYTFPPPFAAGDYAFSPDMSEIIQHEAYGSYLSDRMYRQKDGQLERLFPDWQRLRGSTWSPDGSTIAFYATKGYPKGSSDDLDTMEDIAGLATYPWDLYLMDADGSNVRVLFPMIDHISSIYWSPVGKRLAFAGTYKGQDGLWLW